MRLQDIFVILLLHFISDFIFQSDEMAKNKSTSVKWLTIHVLIYSILFTIYNPIYGIVNGLLHWVIDYFSSKVTSYLWKNGQVHNFFAVIGLDQLLHYVCLFLTYKYIIGGV